MASIVSSCTTLHASRAFLYSDQSGTGKGLQQQTTDLSKKRFGSNPVFVAADSKFSIRLDEIHPGWLLQQSNSLGRSRESQEQRRIRDNIQNKELWVLTSITSLNNEDPLEAQSKFYFKSTSVKLGSTPFSAIPLDEAERIVFTHDADMSYRVRIQVYEIDGLDAKREFKRFVDDPGIAGVIKSAWDTAVNTSSSLAGAAVTRRLRAAAEEPLALERLLLKAGATEEFFGEFHIIRKDSFVETNGSGGLHEQRYALVDVLKSELPVAAEFVPDRLFKEAENLTKIPEGGGWGKDAMQAAIQFSVIESLSPTANGKTAIVGMSIADVERELNLLDAHIADDIGQIFRCRSAQKAAPKKGAKAASPDDCNDLNWTAYYSHRDPNLRDPSGQVKSSLEIANRVAEYLRGQTQSSEDIETTSRAIKRLIELVDDYGENHWALHDIQQKGGTEAAASADAQAVLRQLTQQKFDIETKLRAQVAWMLKAHTAVDRNFDTILCQKNNIGDDASTDRTIDSVCRVRANLKRMVAERQEAEKLLAHLLLPAD